MTKSCSHKILHEKCLKRSTSLRERTSRAADESKYKHIMSWHPLCPTQLTLRSKVTRFSPSWSLKSKLQLLRQSDAKSYEVSQAQKALLLLPHTAKGQARHRKSLMYRYYHELMMSIIFHTMKTTCKSTSVLEPTATAMIVS